MSQYFIKVRSCDTNQEPEWWSRQIVSPTQSNLFWNNGNVGIGVPNPLATLQVDGNVGIGTAYAAIAPPIDGLIVSGNVGIGTANPQAKLDVLGTLKVSNVLNSTLGGLLQNFWVERNGALVVGSRLAWGNGSSISYGARMPFAGKIHYATGTVATITNGSGTLALSKTVAGVQTLSTTHTITISNTEGTFMDWRTNPYTFNAGDLITWECTDITGDGITWVVAWWASFDIL